MPLVKTEPELGSPGIVTGEICNLIEDLVLGDDLVEAGPSLGPAELTNIGPCVSPTLVQETPPGGTGTRAARTGAR